MEIKYGLLLEEQQTRLKIGWISRIKLRKKTIWILEAILAGSQKPSQALFLHFNFSNLELRFSVACLSLEFTT